ncbi:MAG TPA: hypothetical protein PKW90_24595, partial [Myxococcota bacterium]|nr:hypothetical protein [Myxococcota bacterium]
VTGSHLPHAKVAANQELQIATDRANGNFGATIPVGSVFKLRGADGVDIVVARFVDPADGSPPRWETDPNLSPELKHRLLGHPLPPAPAPAPAPIVSPDTSPDRTEAGLLGWMKGILGFGGTPKEATTSPGPPPTTGDLHGAMGPDTTIDVVRPGSGTEARYLKEGFNLVVEVPPGRSPDQVRQDLQRQLASEEQAALSTASTELGNGVSIIRTSGGEPSYQRRPDGSIDVRLPYGYDLSNLGSALKKRKENAALHLAGTSDHSTIQTSSNVVVGSPITDVDKGHSILRRLTQGDLSALEEVGVHGLGDGFDTDVGRRSAHEIEWGLGQLPDGSVGIIRGEHGAVDWGRYPDVVALAHSHPTLGPDGTSKALDLKGGDTVEQILDDIGNNVALLPSS